MKRYLGFSLLAYAIALGFVSCSSHHYSVQSVDYQRVTIDSLFDATPDAETANFLAPFKAKVDSLMSPVVGRVACDMDADRPESKLSNLLADILIWAGKDFDENPVFSVYNMGGIRASFEKGDVTIGDVIEVAPFENKICFMTMKGSQVMTLFEQIAARGGEGVSHSVKAVISKDGKLKSLKINGEEVNPDAEYRIATIDYLSEGNDGMPAFTHGTNRKMLTSLLYCYSTFNLSIYHTSLPHFLTKIIHDYETEIITLVGEHLTISAMRKSWHSVISF